MADAPKPAQARTQPIPVSSTGTEPWPGTGLCPEAQGDGVPCFGTEGECERCGRALPRPPAPDVD